MNSKVKLITLAITAAFTAVGCGKSPASASAESTTGTEGESKSVMDRVKDLTSGVTAKASVQMPATALIAQAISETQPALFSASIDNYRTAIFQMVTGKTPGPEMVAQLGQVFYENTRTGDIPAAVKSVEAALADDKISGALRVGAEEKLKCTRISTKEGSPEAKKCWADFGAHVGGGMSILAAHASRSGWEINPVNGFNGKKASNEEMDGYLDTNAFFAELASILEAELAGKLAQSVMKDPEDAKVRIARAFFAMSPEKIQGAADMAWATVKANAAGGQVLNMNGSKGVEWTAGGSNYLGAQNGWVVTRNGVTWFGDGHAQGKKYELGLESSISASASRKSSKSDTDSAKAGASDKASASTQ